MRGSVQRGDPSRENAVRFSEAAQEFRAGAIPLRAAVRDALESGSAPPHRCYRRRRGDGIMEWLLTVSFRVLALGLLLMLGRVIWKRLPRGTSNRRIALVRSTTHWSTLRRGMPFIAVLVTLYAFGVGSPIALLALLGAGLHETATLNGLLAWSAFGLLALVPALMAVTWIEELLHLALDFLDVAMRRRLPDYTDAPADGASRERAD